MRFRMLSIILILLYGISFAYGDYDGTGNQEPHSMAIEAKPSFCKGPTAGITAMSIMPMRLQYHNDNNGILNPEDFNFTSFILVNSGIVILILVVFRNIKRR